MPDSRTRGQHARLQNGSKQWQRRFELPAEGARGHYSSAGGRGDSPRWGRARPSEKKGPSFFFRKQKD